MKKMEFLDSTLRDGAQGMGIAFSTHDKLEVIELLDQLKIDYIECGNPMVKNDLELFKVAKEINLTNSQLVAFSSTKRKNSKTSDDENLKLLLEADTKTVSIFGKAWDLHVKEVLNTTPGVNLSMISDSIKFLKDNGKTVFFDFEHFFDGFKSNESYALETIETAKSAGADKFILCDTNGGKSIFEVEETLKKIKNAFPNLDFGLHFHNDMGLAVACSMIGANLGFSHHQGTLLGFGERCGNANLSTLIPNLKLKEGFTCNCDTKLLTNCSIKLSEVVNQKIDKFAPYIGSGSFYHKAGMHADGMVKNALSFEHIEPQDVGNNRSFPISEMSGRHILSKRILAMFPNISSNLEILTKIGTEIKELESKGYQFELAEASLKIRIKKILGEFKEAFQLVYYRCSSEQPPLDKFNSTSVVKIKIGDKPIVTAADGDGPIHALDIALKRALKKAYPEIQNVNMSDYKVRVLDGKNASASSVRVLYTSTDGKETWTTVGVSKDIIEASWIALRDSIEYKLSKIN